jgi:hypothetical protein
MFATIVDKRDAVTLNSEMVKYIRPGSIVAVDCWKGYKPWDFIRSGWEYQSVNHEEHWVDPVTGVTTNSIEGNWRGFKTTAPRTAFSKARITPYLLFHVWKRKHRGNWWPRLLYALANCDWESACLEKVDVISGDGVGADVEANTSSADDYDIEGDDSLQGHH